LVEKAEGLGGASADHAARQHGLHGAHRPHLLDRAGGAVKAWEDTEFHFRESNPRTIVTRGDAIMAGEDQFQSAADTYAVDGRNHRHRQAFDTIEHRIDRAQAIDHLLLAGEVFKFPDVGADDECAFLARHQHEAAHVFSARLGFNLFDDRLQFFDRAAAKRVGALAFAVEDRPGDAFAIDAEAPVFELRGIV